MKKRTPKDPDSIQIPSLFGLSPGKWLTILYGSILLIALFFLFIFPGIKNPHSELRVTSQIPMALYIDDLYVGGTPLEIDVPKGEHTFRLERDFFEPIEWEENIPSRLIGSLFFSKVVKKSYSPTIEEVDLFLQAQYKELSQWALVDNFTDNYVTGYHYPSIITETAEALIFATNGPFIKELESFFYAAQRQLSHQEIVNDYKEATSLAEAKISLFIENDTLITDAFKEDNTSIQEYFTNTPVLTRIPATGRTGEVISIEGKKYIYVEGGSYTLGGSNPENLKEAPYNVELEPFAFLDHEVTVAEFFNFLEENPTWKGSQKKALKEQGLVDDYYLQNITSTSTSLPVTYVSWYAAQAYADWLDSQLGEDYTVTLPTESEWELATRIFENSSSGNFNKGTPYLKRGTDSLNLMGNVWEWMKNDYAPMAGITGSYEEEFFGLSGAEKSLRGGSYIDTEGTVLPETRGSHPPEWTTPVVGFRVVIRSNSWKE